MSQIDINRVLLIGEVATDPEIKQTQAGYPYLQFRIKLVEHLQRQAHVKPMAVYLAVTVWHKYATQLADTLYRGARVEVHGKIYARKYQKNGQDKYVFQVNASSVEIQSEPEQPAPVSGQMYGDEDFPG